MLKHVHNYKKKQKVKFKVCLSFIIVIRQRKEKSQL